MLQHKDLLKMVMDLVIIVINNVALVSVRLRPAARQAKGFVTWRDDGCGRQRQMTSPAARGGP